MFQITDAAYQQMIKLVQGSHHKDLRIDLYDGGKNCPPAFSIRCAALPQGHAEVIRWNDIRLWTSPEAFALLRGYTVDFSEGMFGGGFRFIAPIGEPSRHGKSVAV